MIKNLKKDNALPKCLGRNCSIMQSKVSKIKGIKIERWGNRITQDLKQGGYLTSSPIPKLRTKIRVLLPKSL